MNQATVSDLIVAMMDTALEATQDEKFVAEIARRVTAYDSLLLLWFLFTTAIKSR